MKKTQVCSMNSIGRKTKTKIKNLKSEISQDYYKKSQRNCTFMNSISIYLPRATEL